MSRGGLATALVLSGALWACGDSGAELDQGDRGAGVAALGGSAMTRTLARASTAPRPGAELAWVADAITLAPGRTLRHAHELAFVYARRGEHMLRAGDGEQTLAEGEGAVLAAGATHSHTAGDEASVFWEIRLAPPGAPAPAGARRVFESEPLERIPRSPAASFIEVTVPPRGGRTTVHTHPGPEFIYQLSGQIDYQNEIIGTRKLGPGGAEAIPPGTAVQKRNPYREPAVFLSWFLVDPERSFAPRAEF